MRYLLIAGLLLLPLIAWAADYDSADVTLTIDRYLSVDIEASSITCTTKSGSLPGTVQFEGTSQVDVVANAGWKLTWENPTLTRTGGSETIATTMKVNNSASPLTGDMSADDLPLVISGSYGIGQRAGTYTGTATVTIAAN